MSIKSFLNPRGYVPFIALVSIVFFPLFLGNPFYLNILILTIFYAALGSAWNIIGGYGGQLSIGHTAFFGIGAYTSTLLYVHLGLSPWVGMLLGALLSMGVAAVVGYPSFRLRGPFFALSTIAFAEVLSLVALNWRGLTKGAEGLIIEFKPSLAKMLFASKLSYVYLILGLLLLILGVVLRVNRSRFGYYLRALRDDEDAASVLGVNTTRVKLLALMMSAFFTSLGGTFYAQYFLLIDPYIVFSTDFSIQLALVSIIGGMGTSLSPIIGSFLMTPLSEFLRANLGGKHQGLHLIIYGALLIAVVMFIPQGIIEGMRKRYLSFLSLLPGLRLKKIPPSSMKPSPSILHTNPLTSREDAPFSCLLEAKHVSKFFGGLAAISQLDFKLYQNEILGLIGPNGAGKTTLFNLLSGFYVPNEGEIHFAGKNAGKLKPHLLCRMGMGRTFQIVKPFGNMSALENVMVGSFSRRTDAAAAKVHAEELLSFVGLWEKRDLLAKSLTLAEKKHLEMAKALATQPVLILLDEVMSGLNPREVEDAMALIQKINRQGITVIVIEHVMAAIMSLSHRIMVLHHGEKIAEGTPDEIAKNPRVIEAYLGEEYLIA